MDFAAANYSLFCAKRTAALSSLSLSLSLSLAPARLLIPLIYTSGLPDY